MFKGRSIPPICLANELWVGALKNAVSASVEFSLQNCSHFLEHPTKLLYNSSHRLVPQLCRLQNSKSDFIAAPHFESICQSCRKVIETTPRFLGHIFIPAQMGIRFYFCFPPSIVWKLTIYFNFCPTDCLESNKNILRGLRGVSKPWKNMHKPSENLARKWCKTWARRERENKM